MSPRTAKNIRWIFSLVTALVFLAQFAVTTDAAVSGEAYGTQSKPITPKHSLFQLIPHNEENVCSDEIKKWWLLTEIAHTRFPPTILRRSCFKFDLKQVQLTQNIESVILPLFSHTFIEFHPTPRKPIPHLKRKDSRQLKEPDSHSLPYSWTGRIKKVNGLDETGTAALIVDESRQTIEGIIRYDTTLVRIQPLTAGLHAIIEIDTTKLPDEADPDEADTKGQTEGADTTEYQNRIAHSLRADTENASSLPQEADCTTAPYTIDILVFYTSKSMRKAGGSQEAFEHQLRLTVDDANLINEINEVPIRLNLVGLEETTYEEKGDIQEDLNNLTSGNDPSGIAQRAADLRDTLQADLVSLFVEYYEGYPYCGMGKTNNWNSLSPEKAFSAVVQHCSANHLSMLHEFGHNMGAKHESSSRASSTDFARGHRSESAKQYTIMATSGGCRTCERIPYWSTPDYTYVNHEEKRGDKWADNTTAIRTVACQVSKFR